MISVAELYLDVWSNVTLTLVTAVACLLVYALYNQLWKADTWENYGVKQATMGLLAFTDIRTGCYKLIQDNGDTVGTNNGAMFLFTRDLSLLRMIMVKDFNKFSDRMELLQTNSPVSKSLFFIAGHDWKRIRQITSPCFSTGKVKGFSKTINDSAQTLTNVMVKYAESGQLVPIKHLTGQYTSEIIASLGFGLHIDCTGQEDDEFTQHAKKMFKIHSSLMRAVMMVLFRFPGFHKFLVKKLRLSAFDKVSSDADLYFNSLLRQTIAQRQQLSYRGQEPPRDFLHSLVSAKEEGDKALHAAAVAGTLEEHQINNNDLPKTMTDEELIGQAMLTVFAGFETTSTTLQMCLYLLAKHPDIQERVYDEIVDVVSSDTPTHDELKRLKYLGRVICETLRLFPPTSIITRLALETCTYGSVTIPKGAGIMIPLDLIMRDPNHYPDPDTFDPDRFTEENVAQRDPMAFMPFGWGPRLCIGMRLALLELKIALVSLLRKTQFELNDVTAPKAGEEIQTKFQGFIVVEKPVMLSVKLR